MIDSIRYFEEKCISKFEKLEDDYLKEPTKLAEYVMGLTEELHHLYNMTNWHGYKVETSEYSLQGFPCVKFENLPFEKLP